MGPVGRGDIDWKHARPLVAAVATGGSECGCASRCARKPVMSLLRMGALLGARADEASLKRGMSARAATISVAIDRKVRHRGYWGDCDRGDVADPAIFRS